jgi:hypothetical protein
MTFSNVNNLRAEGFAGFIKITDLIKNNCSEVPLEKGIYLVVRNTTQRPEFMAESVGGHFKQRNPAVDVNTLENNWVDNSIVLYIGKAGGESSSATLQSRLRQYMRFGCGEPIGHWGGRYIWQLKDHRELLICWKIVDGSEPRDIERDLIEEFVSIYNKRPFANLTS